MNVEPTPVDPKPDALTNQVPINVNARKVPGVTPTQPDVKAQPVPNVTRITTVPVNWRVKIQFASIHAALCLVVKTRFAYLKDMLLGVGAKMDGKRTKRRENASVNAKE